MTDELTYYLVTYRARELSFEEGFRCWADDEDHAIEQCRNAYPDCVVVEVSINA